MAQTKLLWQSKLVLLLVLPFVAANVVLETHWWAVQDAPVAMWTVGLCLMLGVAAYKLRSATFGAAAAGSGITASLMFSTAPVPYSPWQTALAPVVMLLLLTAVATRMGRRSKERLGTAEKRTGRVAAQVAANMGVAAIVCNELTQSWLFSQDWLPVVRVAPNLSFAIGLAALSEAAADTISSELGQLMSSQPRMITTLRTAEPGTDGAMSLGGTLVGALAAGMVSLAGAVAFKGGWLMVAVSWSGALFGLFFDSLLGATLEQRGWLNNDGVNFLSTASAAVFALGLLAVLPYAGTR